MFVSDYINHIQDMNKEPNPEVTGTLSYTNVLIKMPKALKIRLERAKRKLSLAKDKDVSASEIVCAAVDKHLKKI
jgi:hypothetical protein